MRSAATSIKPYWRIIAVGLLGAIVAFLCSFLVEDTYASGTRLLIRGREATFLTTSAEDLSAAPGVIDSSLAKTLGETQAGLATSREVAVMVVDDLSLDEPEPDEGGFVNWAAGTAAELYARTRALVTFGFYDEPEPREGAIETVQGSISAAPLEDSYVLELVATAETPERARDIADSAADALVVISSTRSSDDAQRNADFLAAQLVEAEADVAAASQAVTDFKVANGISSLDQQLAINAASADELRTQLVGIQVSLAGAQQRLASVEASLGRVDPVQTSTEGIDTGRSSTDIVSTGPNAVYQQLLAERDSIAAEVADLSAQQAALTSRLGDGASTELTGEQAQLVALEQNLQDARVAQTDLSARQREAAVAAADTRVELTRIDTASLPTYPVAPKRYLYLALGLVLGALAGAGLTRLANGRRTDDDEDDEIDLRDDADALPGDGRLEDLASDEPAHAGAGNGKRPASPAPR